MQVWVLPRVAHEIWVGARGGVGHWACCWQGESNKKAVLQILRHSDRLHVVTGAGYTRLLLRC